VDPLFVINLLDCFAGVRTSDLIVRQTDDRRYEMKKLNIPSTFVGLVIGLFTAVVVYLFVPPPQTVLADQNTCDGRCQVYAWNCTSDQNIREYFSYMRELVIEQCGK